MAVNALRRGELRIEDIKLVLSNDEQFDLSQHMLLMDIFESIHHPFMTGFIRISETHDFLNKMPIIGEERLIIKFSSFVENSPDKMFDREFCVYKVDDIVRSENDVELAYTLHFISQAGMKNINKRLKRSFGTDIKPMLGHDIVRNILTTTLEIPEENIKVIEKTNFPMNFVCSNWKPFQAINYVASNQITKGEGAIADNNSTMMIFETSEGFCFVSWATLLEDLLWPKSNKLIDSLEYVPGTVATQADAKDKNVMLSESTTAIEKLEIVNYLDDIDNITTGMYGNSYIYHDAIKKTITTREFDFLKKHEIMSHIENTADKEKLASDKKPFDVQNSISLLPGEYHYEDWAKNEDNPWPQYHRVRIQEQENLLLRARVTANSGHRLGNVIHLTYPSLNSDISDDSQKISGKFLITKINHKIAPNGEYVQALELSKGTFHSTAG